MLLIVKTFVVCGTEDQIVEFLTVRAFPAEDNDLSIHHHVKTLNVEGLYLASHSP
jgi:hypothetical protein